MSKEIQILILQILAELMVSDQINHNHKRYYSLIKHTNKIISQLNEKINANR